MEKIGLQGVFETAAFAAGLKTYTSGINTATGSTNAASTSLGGGGSGGLGGSILGVVGKYVTLAAVVGIATKVLRESVAAASEEETGFVMLEATIQSMGLSAQISAGQIRTMAENMQTANGIFSHDDIEKAAQGFLVIEGVDLSNIQEFLTVAQDFAAGTGQSVEAAGDAISRVLETGQARSLGFSAALRTQVQELVNAGDKAGALTLIMDKLNSKYGGQAIAQLNTYKGSTKEMKNAMDEFWAAVGEGTLGPGRQFNQWVTSIIQIVTEHVDASNQEEDAHKRGEQAIADKGIALKGLFKNTYQVVTATGELTNSTNIFTTSTVDATATEIELGRKLTDQVRIMRTYRGEVEAVALQQELLDAKNRTLITSVSQLASSWKEAALAMLEAQAAADGVITEPEIKAILAYGVAVGLYTEAAAAAKLETYYFTQTLLNLPKDIDINLTAWYSIQMKGISPDPKTLIPAGALDLPMVPVVTGKAPAYMGNGSAGDKAWENYWNGIGPKPYGWAMGGSFIVPPGYPNDSFPLRVQSGEQVSITPASSVGVNNYNNQQSNPIINVYNPLPMTPGDSIAQGLQRASYIGWL